MVGAILKKIRENLGLSQIIAAKQMNMCRSDLCMIEGNKRGVSPKKVKAILDFYQGVEWGITPLEQRILDNFLNSNKNKVKEGLILSDKMNLIDEVLAVMNYGVEIEDNHKMELFDNLEHEALSYLIKKKYL